MEILCICVYLPMKRIYRKVSWKDKEKVEVETIDDVIEVDMGTISENDEENYYAAWKYKDAYYQLSGQIEKEELIKILNEMQYNV